MSESMKIGGRAGVLSAVAGILIAQFIMWLLFATSEGVVRGFFWFAEFDGKLNLLIGVITLLVCGYFGGKLAGYLILIRKWKGLGTGMLIGIAVLLCTAFLSGWVGFFQEGIDNIGSTDNPLEDYIFKPFFWITLFGILPSMFVGLWLGWRIKRKGYSV